MLWIYRHSAVCTRTECGLTNRTNTFKMTVITDWYHGQTILVTGGTGFIGKVLIEKLLRSCTGIKHIYILVRPKRGVAPSARIEEMVKLPIFEPLMKSNPDVLKKLVAIEGDIRTPDLGLSKDQKKMIISEVSTFFHMAASVHMDSGMKTTVINNTLSAKHALDLCLEIKQLKVFVYVSTAFCLAEYEVLGEKVYPPSHNPHDIIHAMEWMDDKTIEIITPRLLGPHPNCYTYTKRLAEYLVYEYRDKLPVCITRPSIVIPAYLEPLPGWVDTLNGPVGILVGAGKGLIRSMMGRPDSAIQAVPVDIAVNSLITVGWKIGSSTEKSQEFPVYNITNGKLMPITWQKVVDLGRKYVHENPFEYIVWYPGGDIRTNKLVHYFCVIFFHYLPAYFIDFILLLARQKRFMVKLQNRITVGLNVLEYFVTRDWDIKNERVLSIGKNVSEEDRKIFYIDNIDYDYEKYMCNAMLGARVYCMKEQLSSLPRARRHHFIMYCLHCIIRILFYGFLVWLLVNNVDSAKKFLDYSVNLLQRIPVIGGFIPIEADNN